MSFNISRFCYLAISFIVGTFFLLIGTLSMILPWSAHLQAELTQFILENTLILPLFGLGFALIGLSIVIYTVLQTRRRTLKIRTGNLAILLDENVIQQYLEAYWEEQFPKSHVSFTLAFKKRSLRIVAELPNVPLADQKQFLERVKNDFIDLFGRRLGYPYDIQLNASFQPEKKN